MRSNYFKQPGRHYLACQMPGWLVSAFALALCIWFIFGVIGVISPGSDTVLRYFVYALSVAYWLKSVANGTFDNPDFTG